MDIDGSEQTNNPVVATDLLAAISSLIGVMQADLTAFPQFTYDNAGLAELADVYKWLDDIRRNHFGLAVPPPSGS